MVPDASAVSLILPGTAWTPAHHACPRSARRYCCACFLHPLTGCCRRSILHCRPIAIRPPNHPRNAGTQEPVHEATYADESVPWLKLEALLCVVDECEAGALSTTKLGAEPEDDDLVLWGLVHGSELVPQLILADVGAGRVQDVHDHLLALQQPVCDLPARVTVSDFHPSAAFVDVCRYCYAQTCACALLLRLVRPT